MFIGQVGNVITAKNENKQAYEKMMVCVNSMCSTLSFVTFLRSG